MLYWVLMLVPIGIGANLLQPYLLSSQSTPIAGKRPAQLLSLCAIYLIVIVFGFATATLGEYGLQSIGMHTLKNIRQRIFRHVMTQGQGFFDRRTTGALREPPTM